MKISNGELIAQNTESFRLQTFDGKGLDEVENKVRATVEVSPVNSRINFTKASGWTATGTQQITTPTTQTFYLKAIAVGVVKDVTCDVATGNLGITIPIGGADLTLLYIPLLSLTASTHQVMFNLPSPIKLDRGGAVKITGSFTAGAMTRSMSIIGYKEDTNA